MTTSEATVEAAGRRADRRGFRLPRSAHATGWLLAGLAVFGWTVLMTPFGRPPYWDEAVFISQSGGLEGTSAPPLWLAASREHGTYTLVRVLRVFAESLASIQLLWAVVAVALVVLAFAATSWQFGRRAALLGLAAYGTLWLPVVMFSSIYGSQLSAATALLGTALYLRLRDAAPRAVWIGVATGLALALMCWMRSLEAALAGGVLVAHALFWRPRELWTRWRAVAAAAGTFVVAFAVPWLVLTLHRWGSLAHWWHASRSQGASRGRSGFPVGLHDGVPDYVGMFIGRGGRYLVDAPTWAAAVAAVGGVLALGLIGYQLVAGLRRVRSRPAAAGGPDRRATERDRAERHGATVLIFAQFAVGLGFFLFLGEDVQERYTMYGVTFAAVLVGAALDGLLPALPRRWPQAARGRAGAALLAAAAVLWLVTQGDLARAAQAERTASQQPRLDLARAIRLLDRGQPCRLLGQASTSTGQLFTDCVDAGSRHRALTTADLLAARTSPAHPGLSYAVFAVWRPGADDVHGLPPGWVTLPGVMGPQHPAWRLSYHLAGPSPAGAPPSTA